MRLNKLEGARRQLETAIKLYFADDDEVSIHTLVAAAYALIRDVNEHRGGEPVLKDLHRLLSSDLAREFKRYINQPENFLKHADKDPEGVGELEPRWTEVLLWEASRKYCEMSADRNMLMMTFVFWFVAHQPELRAQIQNDCLSQGFSQQRLDFIFKLPAMDRKHFFSMLN